MFISNTFLFIIQFFKFCIHFLSYSEYYKKLLFEFLQSFIYFLALAGHTLLLLSPLHPRKAWEVGVWYCGTMETAGLDTAQLTDSLTYTQLQKCQESMFQSKNITVHI